MGYNSFMNSVDAIIMGRKSFETICGFDIDWPYQKHVYVLSTTLKSVPSKAESKATIVSGTLKDVITQVHSNDHKNLYIDGGKTVQSFLKEDLIDELIITTIPILVGGGIPLFGDLANHLEFECFDTKIFANKIVQNSFKRVRK